MKRTIRSLWISVGLLSALVVPVSAQDDRPPTKLFEWDRGFAVQSTTHERMAVYLWFYEWNMFEAMQPGQHTRGNWSLGKSLSRDGKEARITSDALTLSMKPTTDGADLKLTVRNRTNYDFPSIAAIIGCFNPGPADTRNKQFANTNTYFLAKSGLVKLNKREIHFNRRFRKLVDDEAEDGKYVWSEKWPKRDPDAVAGLIVRESTDGRWVCGIAWEEFLSAQGHNPWECMHLSVRVGPLAKGASKTVRGKIYLFEGVKEDLLARYRKDFHAIP